MLAQMFRHSSGADGVLNRPSRFLDMSRVFGDKKHACCFKKFPTYICVREPVRFPSALPRERREHVEVAALLYPAMLLSKSRTSPESVGNKGYNAFFDRQRYMLQRLTPRFKPLASFDEDGIEKVCLTALCRPQRHEVHDDMLALEPEVQTIGEKDAPPSRRDVELSGNDRQQRKAHALACDALCNAKTLCLLGERVMLEKYPRKEKLRYSRPLPTKALLPDPPRSLAPATLPPALPKPPHSLPTAGRFRVSCCHTRELCAETSKNARNRATFLISPSTNFWNTSQNLFIR